MKIKLFFFTVLITAATKTIAQGKFYIVPQVFAFVGSYRGVDSVNKKQTLLKTRNFSKKDFLVGVNLSYYKEPFMITFGVDQAVYTTSFYYKEDGLLYKKASYSAMNLVNYYVEIKYDVWKYNKKLPKRWLNENIKNQYLIVSKISPFIGIDYLRHNMNRISKENDRLNTPAFNIPYELEVFQISPANIGIRTGIDWTFYNGEKRKFSLSFAYRFGFKNIAYHRYHFENISRGVNFYYQTTTKGNGFSIRAGFPIKLIELNKKNRK